MKEAQEAIAEVLDDEKALAAICLSEKGALQAVREGRQVPSMRLAAALLGSYERQIQSVEGALRVRPVCSKYQRRAVQTQSQACCCSSTCQC